MSNRPFFNSITEKLTNSLSPAKLIVNDDSHMHRGHSGVKGTSITETHFSIEAVSDKFAGMNRVQRQRMINTLLADEFANGLHAVALSCKAPGEE